MGVRNLSMETTMSRLFVIPENPDRDCLLQIHRLLTLRIDQLRNVDMGSPQLQDMLFQFEALTAETIQLVEEVAVRLATETS
ncbi:hypothetical protein SAMN05216279_101342 [Pseudomonas oryzihabitans]|uniref:Uncharacterized protein n=3 Tax=Pseudomonadales TaxID=72274 RepID=A0A1G5MAC8_9PSED|nr:hypothetical protein SAMN05216279_101342 [Pseudomonas psychrotolerans]